MFDVREAVPLGDRRYPRLDLRLLDLLSVAALAAHQMVVVAVARADAVQGLTLGRTQCIDAAVLRQALQDR